MKNKRIISGIISFSLVLSLMPLPVFAVGSEQEKIEDDNAITEEIQDTTTTLGELGGYLAGNALNTADLYADRKFTSQKWGFAFAAENGNNLADRLTGLNATVVGNDNAENGADRLIVNRNGNTTLIQTKYYRSASESVGAAFDRDTGLYRYMDGNGKPMQLEVPKDQYDDAVRFMRKRIENGKVPGVTDPNEASNIVRQGSLTRIQAENIAKAGNIDSLKYDATNGIINATSVAGISFVIDYACCRLNGLNSETALENAGLNGIKTGSVVFATYVISSQIAKTGFADSLSSALIPTAEAITKTFGDDVCKAVMRRAGVQTVGKVSTQQVADVLSRELIADGVLVAVLTGFDVADLFRGRISKEEVLKNLTVTIVSVAAGTAGAYGGGALGSLVAPGAGTTVGAVLGSVAAGGISAWAAEKLIAPYYESDAEEMFNIISNVFTVLSDEYLVSEKEANRVVDALKKGLTGNVLKDMFQSEDRDKFARDLLEPLFIAEIEKRPTIVVPSEEEIRYEMKEELQGVVFIH